MKTTILEFRGVTLEVTHEYDSDDNLVISEVIAQDDILNLLSVQDEDDLYEKVGDIISED